MINIIIKMFNGFLNVSMKNLSNIFFILFGISIVKKNTINTDIIKSEKEIIFLLIKITTKQVLSLNKRVPTLFLLIDPAYPIRNGAFVVKNYFSPIREANRAMIRVSYFAPDKNTISPQWT